MLLKIIQCIKFLARQRFPLRGVGADAESHLLQLLQLQCVDCPELSMWLSKKTDKYTSHDIQNEMLKIMALQILRHMFKSIRDSGWYANMADECTDMANKKQFTICIRWAGEDMQDHEDFIGLYEMEKIDADSLVGAIKDTLVRMIIQLTNCRGKSYDGPFNMSGTRNGVAAQTAGEENRAF